MAKDKEEKLIIELMEHYKMWTEDNRNRMDRQGGWNDITDAYYGKLPSEWPYLTRMVDPRIRTSLIEKNARLLNSKLRGSLVPREGVADSTKALVNNAILDYQWDIAKEGGAMLTKLSICDLDARLYASKFALIKWRYEVGEDKKVTFDSNEMIPLDIRDCGLDPSASHIRDANWFQHRSWESIKDLEKSSDISGGKSGFQNILELKNRANEKLKSSKSKRSNDFVPRGKTLRNLQDRLGDDTSFPVVKLVTEYRKDRWITFSPDFKLVVRDIPGPYKHKKIPIGQLRYYHIQDDPLGESEVESVLPLWRAIQATLCGYMDEVILKMRPPLKIIENAARIETIQYGPEAQWLVTRQDAVEEMRSSGDSLAFFKTTYQVLVAAFNVAMGDLSQGISNLGPFEGGNKTATEIKSTDRQRLTRDQKNQNDLSEFITDIMLMWLSNNQQFLFDNGEKTEYIVRIVGRDTFDRFKTAGLAETEISPEALQMVADILEQNPDMSDAEIQTLYETASTPRFPIVTNPNEKDPSKLNVKPKMHIVEGASQTEAEIAAVPGDLEGVYDYIPDVNSMSLSASDEKAVVLDKATALLTGNPTVIELLAGEGFRPAVKELLQASFELGGLKGAEKFFKEIKQNEAGGPQMGGAESPVQVPGVPGVPQTNTGAGVQQPVARSG